MTLRDVLDCGIVGAGGAGFPTHVKLNSRPEYLIVNAAECEPLFHKDAEIIRHHADLFLKGCQIAQELCGSSSVIIGIKKKHKENVALLRSKIMPGIAIAALDDFFPAGDEVTLIYKTTGRIVPPGCLPGSVGCVVQNVETLYNLGNARPVTHKFISVSGAVEEPATFRVPIGASLREVLANVKIAISNYAVVWNGAMMGGIEENMDAPITKRTGGLLILPNDHYVVQTLRRSGNAKAVSLLAKSACDQCSFCTDLCPRYLLGHPVRPNAAMRNLSFRIPGSEGVDPGNAFCCDCNLCTLFACPEHLDPRGACRIEKAALRDKKTQWKGGAVTPHPWSEYRRVPTRRLKERLGLSRYRDEAPLKDFVRTGNSVCIPLGQHVGAPAQPGVKVGDRVNAGDCIGRAVGEISANVHASIGGAIRMVTPAAVTIGEG